jgi:hypothetical protein
LPAHRRRPWRLGFFVLVATTALVRPADGEEFACSNPPWKTTFPETLFIPSNPDASGNERRKLVFLHGQRLVGKVIASYRDGVCYLNGVRWHPPKQPEKPASQDQPLQYKELTPTLEKLYGKIPFVQRQTANGIPMVQAVNEYMNRMHQTIDEVWKCFCENAHLGVDSAAALASFHLDSSLVVTDPSSRHAPKFSDSGILLYFEGYGGYEVMLAPAGERQGPTAARADSVSEASGYSEVSHLKDFLIDSDPAVVIYGRNGSYAASGGASALRAPKTLNAFLSTQTSAFDAAAADTGVIPATLMKEIFDAQKEGE